MQVLSCRCIYKYLRSRVCGDIKPPRYLGRGLRPRPIKTAARRRRQSHAAMGPAYQPVLLLLSLWLHCTVTRHTTSLYLGQSTGWPGCLVLKQGSVYQLFLGVFLMFLACSDHARWAKFHLGILGPQE